VENKDSQDTASAGLGALRPLRKAINDAVSLPAYSLEQAAQNVARLLYEEFKEAVVLARLFITVSHLQLPAPLRTAVQKIAAGARQEVRNGTPVLTLIGTYGAQADWCDSRLSQGHAVIPLISPSFVSSLPMIALMLEELGIDVHVPNKQDRDSFVDRGRFMSGAFYVEDAATATDRQDRKVISAQDFVAAHGVHTVFGAGAAYPSAETILTLILFTRQRLPASVKRNAMIAINELRALTQHHVASQRIFA